MIFETTRNFTLGFTFSYWLAKNNSHLNYICSRKRKIPLDPKTYGGKVSLVVSRRFELLNIWRCVQISATSSGNGFCSQVYLLILCINAFKGMKQFYVHKLIRKTRLHSSRMRTARALTVSLSLLCAGDCAWSGGCLLLGGACSGGGVPPGVGGWWYPSMHWGRLPPVNRITHACENISLPQLRCGR